MALKGLRIWIYMIASQCFPEPLWILMIGDAILEKANFRFPHSKLDRVPQKPIEFLDCRGVLATFQFMDNPHPGINENKTRRSAKSLFSANSFS
uniref:Uncharacterized protein n=1 Tax=Trichobilharzia regenti TaxID=157069 RepID=A0AA85K0H0_TRIRE|nr:unnamed protein product [Trichobilharzia regenti]